MFVFRLRIPDVSSWPFISGMLFQGRSGAGAHATIAGMEKFLHPASNLATI
jgi:hypothetical protein